MAARASIKEIRFFLRNVRTRMPFKYGAATLTSVPILQVLMEVELENSARATGLAADILPPRWFDKDPAKSYQDHVADLLWVARAAASAYATAAREPRAVFATWQEGYAATLEAGEERGLNHLTAGHGSSLMERALIDAVGMALNLSYYELLCTNALGLDLGQLHPELGSMPPAQVIALAPLSSLHIRHTVGLADPIRSTDIPPQDRLADDLPQSLEEYLQSQRLSYFKVKVSGSLEPDLERLAAIASLLDSSGREYQISLDGNEQYKDMESFLELVGRVEADPRLARFWSRVLYIEQPLERSLALEPALALRAVARKPLLIDESDSDLDSFRRAADLGYLGVSAKNCKGLIKALANQALARYLARARQRPFFLSGEDLMNLPVVPLHQDLAQLAALGIPHAERNGHHYVRGLDHLSPAERRSCGQAHGRLYRPLGDSLALDIREGRIDLSSLQCPGLGVGIAVDVKSMTPLEDWQFASLA